MSRLLILFFSVITTAIVSIISISTASSTLLVGGEVSTSPIPSLTKKRLDTIVQNSAPEYAQARLIRIKKSMQKMASRSNGYRQKRYASIVAYIDTLLAQLADTHVMGSGLNNAISSPRIGGCPIFPVDNARNADISGYPLHPRSAQYIASINNKRQYLHPDFGANRDGGPFGIPYVIVDAQTPKLPVTAIRYADESDEGNFPVPRTAPVEKGGDHHVIAVDKDACMLYELFAAELTAQGWNAGSVAMFNLRSNALRPDGWTSADAAGLPIFAGLVRYDEVAAGEIHHALRFTVSQSQKGYIAPATHQAGKSTDENLPPMGLRLRMKADYDISHLHGQARVIAEALKKYGMIVADNGSDRFISGAPDSRWDDDDLGQLKRIPGSAFEVVDTGPIQR